MHELSITTTLLEKVLLQAEEHGLTRVSEIQVKLGEFSGFVDDSIEFYWKHIARDTIAAKASLKIHREPGKIRCLKCMAIIANRQVELCPKCGSFKLEIIGGDELLLVRVKGES